MIAPEYILAALGLALLAGLAVVLTPPGASEDWRKLGRWIKLNCKRDGSTINRPRVPWHL